MNTSRLRADIDAGNTGDKTPGEDPAAAPLGTDEEAAGTPIDPALAEQVRPDERRPEEGRGLRMPGSRTKRHAVWYQPWCGLAQALA
jgi:hypothetical protein